MTAEAMSDCALAHAGPLDRASAFTASPKSSAPLARKTVLLSAFACSPLWGSEPGVGWHWATQLALRHDVIVLTHGYFRAHIEKTQLNSALAGVRFEYLSPPTLGLHPHKQLNSRLFYTWWQWLARKRVQTLCASQKIDLLHHLTWGTFRFPIFLGGLGVPLVMGPLGGGDVAPMRLYQGLPFAVRFVEGLRAASLRLSRFDPLVRRALSAADLILCKTDDTRHALPDRHGQRALVASEIGAPQTEWHPKASGHRDGPFKILFAGRLIGLKGVMLLLGTVKLLQAAGHDVQLQLAGDGPLKQHLQTQAEAMGIAARVQLSGSLPRQQLMELYGQSDLFFFPSLHDSSGNVVLEALSRGLPVICLDLGGPKHYVTPDCGVVVATTKRTRAQVEEAFAQAIAQLIGDRSRLARMSEHAVSHAQQQSWQACVARTYETIEQRFAWTA
jgi:glycosyltransferase involved in cell wall biosynthesis